MVGLQLCPPFAKVSVLLHTGETGAGNLGLGMGDGNIDSKIINLCLPKTIVINHFEELR